MSIPPVPFLEKFLQEGDRRDVLCNGIMEMKNKVDKKVIVRAYVTISGSKSWNFNLMESLL